MASARVTGQTIGNVTSGGTSINASFGVNVTAGNTIMVAVGNYYTASTITVSDNLSNTYTLLYTATAGGGQKIRIYGAFNITGGACTVTVGSSSAEYMGFGACEYTGTVTVAAIDGSSYGSGTGTSCSAGKFPSTVSSALIFGMVYDTVGTQSSITGDSPSSDIYTHAAAGTSIGVSDVVAAPFQTHEQVWTFGTSHTYLAASVAVKDASAATVTRDTTSSDNFNRADENPITNPPWVSDTGWDACKITGNVVDGSTTLSCVSRWNPTTPIENQWAQVTITSGAAISYQAPAVRMAGSSSKTGYFLFAQSSTILQIYKYVGGSASVLMNLGGQSINSGDTIALEVFGTGLIVTLRAYINDVQKGGDIYDTAADRITSAGLLAIHVLGNAGQTLDDFIGGNLTTINNYIDFANTVYAISSTSVLMNLKLDLNNISNSSSITSSLLNLELSFNTISNGLSSIQPSLMNLNLGLSNTSNINSTSSALMNLNLSLDSGVNSNSNSTGLMNLILDLGNASNAISNSSGSFNFAIYLNTVTSGVSYIPPALMTLRLGFGGVINAINNTSGLMNVRFNFGTVINSTAVPTALLSLKLAGTSNAYIKTTIFIDNDIVRYFKHYTPLNTFVEDDDVRILTHDDRRRNFRWP